MSRIERSLLTRQEWVAFVHHITKHPHIHIALRGVDDHGTSLRLPRAFIRSGIRQHAKTCRRWNWDIGLNVTLAAQRRDPR
jgi:type IV secretory pathway VirD2 relaxase